MALVSCRALHNVARVGKRALGYAIAKRMAALNSLDLKDSDGMVTNGARVFSRYPIS